MRTAEYMSAAVARRPKLLSACLAALFAGTAPAWAAEPADPLSPLTSGKGSMLCFQRDYSAEHLAQHQKQTVKAVLLAFQEKGRVDIVLIPRTGAPKRIAAGCGWSRDGAGIDTSGHRMIPNFSKSAAFDCIVTVGESAEEGGYLLIDPAEDAKSLTLFLQSPITTDDVEYGKGKGYNLMLGTEDRTFYLPRTDAKACASFKAPRP